MPRWLTYSVLNTGTCEIPACSMPSGASTRDFVHQASSRPGANQQSFSTQHSKQLALRNSKTDSLTTSYGHPDRRLIQASAMTATGHLSPSQGSTQSRLTFSASTRASRKCFSLMWQVAELL